jgi:hypothetical protein
MPRLAEVDDRQPADWAAQRAIAATAATAGLVIATVPEAGQPPPHSRLPNSPEKARPA